MNETRLKQTEPLQYFFFFNKNFRLYFIIQDGAEKIVAFSKLVILSAPPYIKNKGITNHIIILSYIL